MVWVTRGNLKGPTGTIDAAFANALPTGSAPTVTLTGNPAHRTFTFGIPAGATGAQGLPGVNAVANDTATAGYISTTGTSATKTAALALINTQVTAARESDRTETMRLAFTPPSMQDQPVVSYVGWDTAILAGNTRFRAAAQNQPANMTTDPAFRYEGAPALATAYVEYVAADMLPGGSGAARYSYQVETVTQSTNSYLWIILRPAAGGTFPYRLWIDGKPTSLRAATIGPVTAGAGIFVRLDFPSARSRHIRFQVHGDAAFGGMLVPTGQTLVRPISPIVKRVAILGDSFVGGSGDTNRLETGAYLAAMMLGADSIWHLGLGGTGYTTAAPYQDRVAPTLAANPHMLIIGGTRNDGTAGSATLRTAAQTLYAAVKTQIPATYVTGPSTIPYAPNNLVLKEETVAAGLTFVDGLAEPWIIEAKHIGADNIHPNWIGHRRIASRLHEGISAAMAP